MRYLKTFESINDDDIQVGDYILLDKSHGHKIGRVEVVRAHYNEVNAMFDPPTNFWYGIMMSSIEYWSKNKEDLEAILDAEKYNL